MSQEEKSNNQESIQDRYSQSKKITWSDAKVLLNQGKMTFVFIGIVLGFFLLNILLSVFSIPLIAYLIIAAIAIPFFYFYYLHIHAHDEEKLD